MDNWGSNQSGGGSSNNNGWGSGSNGGLQSSNQSWGTNTNNNQTNYTPGWDAGGQNSFQQPQLPMKWHKFLIYFWLWLQALVCVGSAGQVMSGLIFGSQEIGEQVFQTYASMKPLCTAIGVAYLILAVYVIYTRFQLARLKSGAPGKLLLIFVFSLVLNLAFIIGAAAVSGVAITDLMDSQFAGSVAMIIVMLLANKNYYDKRAHLFVN